MATSSIFHPPTFNNKKSMDSFVEAIRASETHIGRDSKKNSPKATLLATSESINGFFRSAKQ